MPIINPYSHFPGTMLSAIQRAGLTSNLVLCLDAGDINSYDGTSQTWTDVSGSSNNFYRGSGSGSDSADPTFNGTAGRQSSSEYFSSDGDDSFVPTASHTFAQAWHKDGATFTIAAWLFIPTGAAKAAELIRAYRDTTDVGAGIFVSPLSGQGRPGITAMNGSSAQVMVGPTEDIVVENSWMFCGVSFSEGSGSSFAFANSTIELLSSDSYTSPSASNSPNIPVMWGSPDAAGTALDSSTSTRPSSGTRFNSLLAWNTFLTQAQITSIYTMTRGKFGV